MTSNNFAGVKPATAVKNSAQPYRVMLVDDSAVIRGKLTQWLNADPNFSVVGSYCNGLQAVQNVKSCGAEIVILDIEMPQMDGLTALPKLLAAVPRLRVIMASTLTRRNADVSLKALSMGAVDYLPKPESAKAGTGTEDFHRELIAKLRAIGAGLRRQAADRNLQAATGGARTGVAQVKPSSQRPVMRARSLVRPRVLAIGSSTGGPQALFKVLGGIGKNELMVPVIVTQHMPPTFTAILAEHIQNMTGLPASEAKNGERLQPGHVYVAPGDYHMTVEDRGDGIVLALNQGPQVNFCRPAVDPMFESVATVFGAAALCLVLTGMGHDGREGGKKVVAAGGTVIAQDEATSVVWEMPGAAAEAGICAAVLPLPEIASTLQRYFRGAP